MENNDQIALFHQGQAAIKNEFQSVSMQKGQLLAKKIEMAIKQRGHNRQQFASVMSVQPSIVTRWLSGNHNFTVETLFEIEDKLGIQLISIDRPVYKKMSFHMVVGSEPTQHLNSSLVQGLASMLSSSRITYCIGSDARFIEDCSDNSSFMEFIKFYTK